MDNHNDSQRLVKLLFTILRNLYNVKQVKQLGAVFKLIKHLSLALLIVFDLLHDRPN